MIERINPILFLLGGPARNIQAGGRRGTPPNMCGAFPLLATRWAISGVTRDSVGVALGDVAVELIRTEDSLLMERTTSDGSGNYTVTTVGGGTYYHIDAYKVGSPDVAGTTKNTLVGS